MQIDRNASKETQHLADFMFLLCNRRTLGELLTTWQIYVGVIYTPFRKILG